MAHDWEGYTPPGASPGARLMAGPWRRCRHCGFVQERITETLWMRVTGYKWRPLAGHCRKPVIEQLERKESAS